MAVKELARKIGEICDDTLNHPNIVDDAEDPNTSIEDLRYDIQILTKSLEEIWSLASKIYEQAPD
jgi:hypothetical protein